MRILKNAAPWLAVLALLVSGCHKNGDLAKREAVKRGDALMDQKKYGDAIVEYRKAIQLDARFGEARKKLSIAYIVSGEIAAAYHEAIMAADLLPQDGEAQLNAARALLRVRQFDDARLRAQNALALNPRDAQAAIIRANALAGMNKLDDAIGELQDAIRKDPVQLMMYATLGTMQAIKGDRHEAESAFKHAVELAPTSVEAKLSLANFYWAIGRMKEAEDEFQHVLSMEPKNFRANEVIGLFYVGSRRVKQAEPYLKTAADNSDNVAPILTLADYYFGQQRPADARRVLENAAKTHPVALVAIQLRLAGLDVGSGDVAAAMRRVEAVLDKQPNNADALDTKAQLLAATGKLEDALGAARLAVRWAPKDASTQFVLGRMNLATRHPEEAAAAFTEALQLNPRLATAEVELAQLKLAAGRLDEAEQFTIGALRKIPGYVDANLLFVRINLMKGDLAKAEMPIRTLAQMLPTSPVVQAELGQLELAKGNKAAARQAFEQALAVNAKQIDAIAGLLTLDIQDKRTDAVKARVDRLVQASSSNAQMLSFAGRVYGQIGDAASSERALRAALKLDPNQFDAYSMLGQLYVSQRRLDDAIAEFTILTQKQAKPVAAYTMLGMLLKAENKLVAAQEQYQRALDLNPDAAVAANNLAWMYVETGGNLDVAMGLAKKAKAQLPDRADISDTLGWIYYKKGLYALAVPTLLESTDKDPQNPVYRYHLGAAYVAAGERTKARNAFETALAGGRRFPDSDNARRALEKLKG